MMWNVQFRSSLIVKVCLVILLGITWYYFAPSRLGGRASYVIVNGNSMEPAYQRGDLIIVAEASSYTKGDVVTYRDDQMGAYVIHRIIGEDGDRYILKGDHNYWTDSTRPKKADIIGKQWIFLPEIGNYVIWLRDPGNMAFIMFFLGAGVILSTVMQTEQKSPQKKKSQPVQTGLFEYALYTISALALVFLVATVYSFTRPLQKQGARIPYTLRGEFSYSAPGSSNIYDGGGVSTGSPVFFKLTCAMDLEYQYSITSERAEAITGTQYLSASVIDKHSGWRRTIPLTQERPFMGNSFKDKASLDLCYINDMIRSVEAETGFRSNSYTLNITSVVKSTGIISGQPFLDTLEQSIDFTIDTTHLYLENTDKNNNPFKSIKEKLINNPSMVANSITVGNVEIPVTFARIFSVSGLAFMFLAFIYKRNYFDKL